jgi:RNA polymerase sigma-70 factor (sigma-E family)
MAEGNAFGSDFEVRFDALFTVAYRSAFRLAGDRHQAEDVAQEAMARCFVRWTKVGTYAEAWVSRTATNLVIDRWRRKEPLSEDLDRRRSGTVNAPAELRADLVRALRSLSRRQREVVVLRYLVDLPEQDVADALHCSTGTVKRHAHRGLERMRSLLGDSYGLAEWAAAESAEVRPVAGDLRLQPDV